MTAAPTIGSLFTGLGLLDEGVRRVLGGELLWFAESAGGDAERVVQLAADGMRHADICDAMGYVRPVRRLRARSRPSGRRYRVQNLDPARRRRTSKVGAALNDARRAAWCRAVVQQRHPAAWSLGDVCSINGGVLPYVDVLALGFPCQDISPAGSAKGLAGAKSGLWSEVARILREMDDRAPHTIIIENSGYLPSRGLAVVLRDLAELGYDAGWQVVGAVAVGAPHIRERCAIVARLDSRLPRWPELAPMARANLAEWYTPDREPAPRTVPPYPKGDPRVQWRADAVAALGNAVNLHWAMWVAAAARDARPPHLDLFGVPFAKGIRWADAGKLPRSGIMWAGKLYHADPVYSRSDAEAITLAAPICELYGRLLPTPTKNQFTSNQGGAAGRTNPVRPALQTLARTLPTLRKADTRSGATSRVTSVKNSRPLCEVAARMLPTPVASLGRRGDCPGERMRRSPHLGSIAVQLTEDALLATPTRKGNDNRAGLSARSGDGLGTQARAMPRDAAATLLAVEWCAWLQGVDAAFVPMLARPAQPAGQIERVAP